MYEFQWTEKDFEIISKFEKFKNENSDENLVKIRKKKLKMDRSQIEKENEIFNSDEKWAIPDNFKGISKEDISHIENENKMNSNEKWTLPQNFEEITSFSGLTESFFDFDPNEPFPFHCLYWPISDFDPSDLTFCARTQSSLEIDDFVSNHMEYDYNSDEILNLENTPGTDQSVKENYETRFFQDFISMHSNDFNELSEQLEFLEEKHINVPTGTAIFPVPRPYKIAEPTLTVLSDTIPQDASKLEKQAEVLLKQLKPVKSRKSKRGLSAPLEKEENSIPKKSKKDLSTSSEKEENSIPSKMEFNKYFEKNDYVIKVPGKDISLNRDLSDFMKLYHKGSIQKIAEYILEKLVDGDLSTYSLTGRNYTTGPDGKRVFGDSKKNIPKQIVNELKKFVETLVPKTYFSRKMSPTRMNNILIQRVCDNQNSRIRRKINRNKYLLNQRK